MRADGRGRSVPKTFGDGLAQAWEALNESERDVIREQQAQLWRDTLAATEDQLVKAVEIICKDCGHKRIYDIPVRVPDLRTRVWAAQVLDEVAHGKPVERRQVDVNVLVAHTLAELEGLSNAELAAYVGAEEAEWAELPELPPAA